MYRYVEGWSKRLKNSSMVHGIVLGEAIEQVLMENLPVGPARVERETEAADLLILEGWQKWAPQVDWTSRELTGTQACLFNGEPNRCLDWHLTAARNGGRVKADWQALHQLVTGEDPPPKATIEAIKESIEKARPGLHGFTGKGCLACGREGVSLAPWGIVERIHNAQMISEAFWRSPERARLGRCYGRQMRGLVNGLVVYPDVLIDVQDWETSQPHLLDLKAIERPYPAGYEHMDRQLTIQAKAWRAGGLKGVNFPPPEEVVPVGFLCLLGSGGAPVDLRLSERTEADFALMDWRVRAAGAKRELAEAGGWPAEPSSMKCGFCDAQLLCRRDHGEAIDGDLIEMTYSKKGESDAV